MFWEKGTKHPFILTMCWRREHKYVEHILFWLHREMQFANQEKNIISLTASVVNHYKVTVLLLNDWVFKLYMNQQVRLCPCKEPMCMHVWALTDAPWRCRLRGLAWTKPSIRTGPGASSHRENLASWHSYFTKALPAQAPPSAVVKSNRWESCWVWI